jgi:hypothetical protein
MRRRRGTKGVDDGGEDNASVQKAVTPYDVEGYSSTRPLSPNRSEGPADSVPSMPIGNEDRPLLFCIY